MARSSARAARLARSRAQAQPQNAISPLMLAFCATVLFSLFAFLPRVRTNPVMLWSFLGASALLLVLILVLRRRVEVEGRKLVYEFQPKPAHYVQMMMHVSLYAYWGWYWRPVYHFMPMIAAQMVFVYALDMLVSWFRRDRWILGFGPFPIILSTNIFIWFRDEYFYLQFVLIAIGVLGKEFLKWRRDGKLTHIFNPSSFSLSVVSFLLIFTRHTNLTWAVEIAATVQRPPHIYLEVFVLGLIVQALFGVTLVTLFAAGTLYAMNLVFTHYTGGYAFVDTNIPAGVFIGMHLLVTDPATSPRTNFGKALFGIAYGAANFGIFWWFDQINIPTFYDKLLPVPFLNLAVPAIDKLCRGLEKHLRGIDLGAALGARRANYAHMAMWVTLFIVMSGTHFIGPTHPGKSIEFWEQACSEGRYNACHNLQTELGVSCNDQVGRACLMQGEMMAKGRGGQRDPIMAAEHFGEACYLGAADGCDRLMQIMQSGGDKDLQQACDRRNGNSCVTLGAAYRKGIGTSRDSARSLALFEAACRAGSYRGCGLAGQSYLYGDGATVDTSKAMAELEASCRHDYGPGCFDAGMMYRDGVGVTANSTLALERFRAACDLGYSRGCEPDELPSAISSIFQ